jgi:hypothetical protein
MNYDIIKCNVSLMLTFPLPMVEWIVNERTIEKT